jgi:omega-amidase
MHMKKIRISLLQMNIIPGEPKANRERAVYLINQAAAQETDIVVLPEMWTTAYQLENIAEICDREGKPTLDIISKKAKEKNINIVAGSFASLEEGKVYNTAYAFDRKGNNISKYQKIHLFKLMEEHKYINAGDKHCVFEMDGVKCGIIICYDLRFPELTRKLALEDIKILFVPAQWPAARLDHWTTLLKARAIENQIFVAAVNRAGEHPSDDFIGGSMLISPWGEIIAQGDYKEQIISAEIDINMIEDAKSKIDILGDRVPHTY